MIRHYPPSLSLYISISLYLSLPLSISHSLPPSLSPTPSLFSSLPLSLYPSLPLSVSIITALVGPQTYNYNISCRYSTHCPLSHIVNPRWSTFNVFTISPYLSICHRHAQPFTYSLSVPIFGQRLSFFSCSTSPFSSGTPTF